MFSVMVADLIKALSLKLLETYVMFLLYLWLRPKPEKVGCLVSINISYPTIGFIQTAWLPRILHYIKSLVCFQSGLWNFQTYLPAANHLLTLPLSHLWIEAAVQMTEASTMLAQIWTLISGQCFPSPSICVLCWERDQLLVETLHYALNWVITVPAATSVNRHNCKRDCPAASLTHCWYLCFSVSFFEVPWPILYVFI